MHLDNMTIQQLRDEYRVYLMRSGYPPARFRSACETELYYMKLDPSPANWVRAAEQVVERLNEEEQREGEERENSSIQERQAYLDAQEAQADAWQDQYE